MKIRDFSNGSEGTIQSFGVGHLTTNDTQAKAGTKEVPALKSESARFPATAVLDKGVVQKNHPGSTHGVGSHPQLQRASQTGSYDATDHRAIHSGVDLTRKTLTKPVVMGSPEAGGSTMPVTVKVQGSEVLGESAGASKPVVARLNQGRFS